MILYETILMIRWRYSTICEIKFIHRILKWIARASPLEKYANFDSKEGNVFKLKEIYCYNLVVCIIVLSWYYNLFFVFIPSSILSDHDPVFYFPLFSISLSNLFSSISFKFVI